jgi:hypothetical protein
VSQARTKDGIGKGVRVHVAAFGKHPGWDDHIEEIGLDTSMLVNAKRLLYTECIGGCIDSGEWEKLDEDRRIPFRHQFYWRTPEGLLIGRMWASRDGKGRTKYPMVVCAVIHGVPDSWAVEQVLPRLAVVEEKCGQTSSAELVRLAIGECRSSLEAAAAAYDGSPGESPAQRLSRLVQSPELSANNGEGLKRVLYEMSREFVDFRPSGNAALRSRNAVLPAQQIRVPKGLTAPGEAALAWMTLLDQEISRSIPLLLVEPVDGRYIDLIVGDIKPKQFYCVRAGEKALGLTSDVPYTMDAAAVQEAQDKIDAWSQGRTVAGAEPITSGAAPLRSKKALRFALLAGAGLAVIAVVFLLTRAGTPDPANAEPPEPPRPQVRRAPAPQPEEPIAKETEEPAEPAAQDPTDPRVNWTYDQAAAHARETLARLNRELAAENSPPRAGERQHLEDIEKRAAIIRNKPWRPATREALVRDMAAVDAELKNVQIALDEALAGVAARIDAFLIQRAATTPVQNRILAAAWGAGLAAIDRSAGWKEARARVSALETNLKAAEAAVAGVALVQPPEDSMLNAEVFKTASAARRDAALRAAGDAAAAGDRERIDAVAKELRDWNGYAVSLLDQGVQLAAMVQSGGVLDPQAKPSASQIIASMQSSPAYNDLSEAFRPVLDQVEAVRAVGSLNDAEALIDVIKGAANDASGRRTPAAVAAWQRLCDLGWPSLPAELSEAAAIRSGALGRALAAVPDSAQRESLEKLTQAPSREMWRRFTAKGGVNEAGLEAAVAARDVLTTGDAASSLPATIRYNLLRKELADALKAADAEPLSRRREARLAAVESFRRQVAALGPEIAAKPKVASFIAAVNKAAESMAAPDVSNLGPGSVGWKAGPMTDDGTVTYTHDKAGQLTFRRISGTESVAFMSTTEVSVGQFIEAISSAGKWDEVRQLLINYPAGGDDPRRGPRTWEWTTNPDAPMAVAAPGEGDTSSGWLRVKTSMAGKAYYPEGLSVEPPSADHPIQYISPAAAVLAARTLGCRLPTTAEWQAAAAATNTTAQNLRDATWRRQFERCKELLSSSPDFPSGGVFRPADAPRVQPLQDGFPAVETDDQTLWFSKVGGGPNFQHLIGNVAEFVWEDSAGMEALPAVAGPIKSALGRWEKLRVVGGSALSAKDIPTNVPQAPAFTQSPEGWSDVGFRLAFTAPAGAGEGGAADLEAALASSGYLLSDE